MNESLKNRFNNIFKRNVWGSFESKSGKGSELRFTDSIIKSIPNIIKEYSISSILDLPCGDYNYMKEVDLACDYIGADIAPDLIELNKSRYPDVRFECLDVTSDPLPKCDLILSRDCLVHLSNADIEKAVANMKKSGAKYLLTTSFSNTTKNIDLPVGGWRKINIELSPFNMEVTQIVSENSGQDNAEDKTLSLIKIN